MTAPSPCGFAKQELIGLLERAEFDPAKPAFKAYFFTNVPGTKKHPTREELDDNVVRCLHCGNAIAEHLVQSWQVADAVRSHMFAALVIRAATFRNFRKKVYQLAVDHGAYDEKIEYSETPISSNADLRITMYFPTEDRSIQFRAKLLHLVESYGGTEPALQISPCDHICTTLSTMSNWRTGITPDRRSWRQEDVVEDPASSASAAYHTQLTLEEIQRECLCKYECFVNYNQKAQWCHLTARKRCRTEDEKKGSANRLVMNPTFHNMFDDNLTNDGETPTLTAYCDPTDAPIESDNGYVKVKLHVLFKNQKEAEHLVWMLREPTMQLSASEFVVWVEKKTDDVVAFRNFLQLRHDAVFAKW